MSASTQIAGVRPQAYTAASYRAFRVRDGHTRALGIDHRENLAGFLNAALIYCWHKDRLVIRETDEKGDRLHVYAIRKKAAQWIQGANDFLPRRVEDHFADPICVIDAEALGIPDNDMRGERR